MEIIILLHFSNRTKFRNKYINPLIAEGLLAMTVPDRPNSRLQKYYTTEKENDYYAKTEAINIQDSGFEVCSSYHRGVIQAASIE